MELSDQIFENAALPDPARRGHIYPVKGYDFRLKRSSKAIDAGVHLPNITEGYLGKAPDLGAIEGSKAPPHYGPRWAN